MSRKKTITPLPLVIIGISFLALVTQVPFLLTLGYSAVRWNLLYPMRPRVFVGLGNYEKIILNMTFPTAVLNTLLFTVFILAGSLILGCALALMLNSRIRGRQLLRTLLMTPFLVIVSVTTLVWRNMILSPTYGFLDGVLRALSLAPIDPLANHPMSVIITIAVWEWTPFMMLILSAALSALPQDTMEAAEIDGAGYFTKLLYIVMPFLRKYLLVCVLIGTIMILPLFGEIHLTTYGGPGLATTNITYLVYRQAFQAYDVGAASAGGVLAVIMTMIIATLIVRVFVRGVQDE